MEALNNLKAMLRQKQHTLEVTKAQILDLEKEIKNEELRLKHGVLCGFLNGNYSGDGGYHTYPSTFSCSVCGKCIPARPILTREVKIKDFACQ